MKVEIAVGTVLGASEYVAEAIGGLLENNGHTANYHFTPSINDIDLAQLLIIVTSTHGAGDLPDNIQGFARDLAKQDLSGLKAVIIGLGDSSYDTFCQASATMEDILTNAGANLLLPVYQIDVLHHPIPEDAALAWLAKHLDSLSS